MASPPSDLAREMYRVAAHGLVWRRYDGESGGDAVRGIEPSPTFTEVQIHGFIQFHTREDERRAVGLIHDERVMLTSRHKIGERDEVEWDGRRYRVESDPMPSVLAGQWTVILRRGESDG